MGYSNERPKMRWWEVAIAVVLFASLPFLCVGGAVIVAKVISIEVRMD